MSKDKSKKNKEIQKISKVTLKIKPVLNYFDEEESSRLQFCLLNRKKLQLYHINDQHQSKLIEQAQEYMAGKYDKSRSADVSSNKASYQQSQSNRVLSSAVMSQSLQGIIKNMQKSVVQEYQPPIVNQQMNNPMMKTMEMFRQTLNEQEFNEYCQQRIHNIQHKQPTDQSILQYTMKQTEPHEVSQFLQVSTPIINQYYNPLVSQQIVQNEQAIESQLIKSQSDMIMMKQRAMNEMGYEQYQKQLQFSKELDLNQDHDNNGKRDQRKLLNPFFMDEIHSEEEVSIKSNVRDK